MMSSEVMPIHRLRSAPTTWNELARNNSAQLSEPDVSRADFDLYDPAYGVAGVAIPSVARDQFRGTTVAVRLQRLTPARA